MFALGYYGLLRVGELTSGGEHTIAAKDIHVAANKDKILVVLYSSKTHHRGSRPQIVKISSLLDERSGKYRKRFFCPFQLMRNYMQVRGDYDTDVEPLFVFGDGAAVKPRHARKILRKMIKIIGLNEYNYNMHSLRVGHSLDMLKYGYQISEIRMAGRWKSNVVFKYLRQI